MLTKIIIEKNTNVSTEEQINKRLQELGPGWKIKSAKTEANIIGVITLNPLVFHVLYVTTVVVEKEKRYNLLKKDLSVLLLSKATTEALVKTEVKSVGEIAGETYKSLLKFRYLSGDKVDEIKYKLSEIGFSLYED